MATTKKKSKKKVKVKPTMYEVQAYWIVSRVWTVRADTAEKARHIFLGSFGEDDPRIKELEPYYQGPCDNVSLEDAIMVEGE